MYDPNQSQRIPALLPAPPGSESPSILDRAWEGLSSFLGGMDNPDLTPEQNANAKRAAMLNTGLGAMASSNAGGSLGDAVTAAAFAGQQSAAMNQEEMIARQEQQLADARRRQIMEMMGVGGLPGMMDAFSFALGNGDFESARAIGSILPAMFASQPRPQAAEKWDLEEGVNPETGNVELFQINPTTGQKRWLGVKAPPKSSGVTINTGDPPKANEFADRFATTDFDNADTMASTLASVNAVKGALTRPDGTLVMTGPLTQFSDRIKTPIAEFFGLDAENLNARQLAEAMTNQGTLDKTSQLAGQISNYEIDFLKATLPRIENLPGGNELIFEAYERMYERANELAALGERYATGDLDGGEYMRARRELRNRQLLGDDFVNRVNALEVQGADGEPTPYGRPAPWNR